MLYKHALYMYINSNTYSNINSNINVVISQVKEKYWFYICVFFHADVFFIFTKIQ